MAEDGTDKQYRTIYRYDWCTTFSFPGIDALPFVSFGSEKEWPLGGETKIPD